MGIQTPEAEWPITDHIVKSLLAAQHPDLSQLSLKYLDSGWDNALYRLGDAYGVRLPRRRSAIAALQNELRWLAQLAPSLPLDIPSPVRTGAPESFYPAPWSIVPWFEGEPADRRPPDSDQAIRLAAFFTALHRCAPPEAPRSLLRGVPLRRRARWVERHLESHTGRTGVVDAWQAALKAPESTERRWIHGDPHGRNIITRDGKLSAVIDWGDLTSGDVANDLAAFWLLFPDAAVRQRALEAYGCDPATQARARGWAVFYAVTFAALQDDPIHRASGLQLLAILDREFVG